MDAGIDTPIYNCIFCGTEFDNDDGDECICGNPECNDQMNQLTAEYMAIYDAYKVKVAALNLPWATAMMNHFESICDPHYMSEVNMYYNFNTLKMLYEQLEYMETNIPTARTITHADHTTIVETLNSKVSQLQLKIGEIQATNSQLVNTCANLSMQCAKMSEAGNAHQTQFTKMQLQIDTHQREKAALQQKVRELEVQLLKPVAEYEEYIRKTNELHMKNKALIATLKDDLQCATENLKKANDSQKAETSQLKIDLQRAKDQLMKEKTDSKERIDTLTQELKNTQSHLTQQIASSYASSSQKVSSGFNKCERLTVVPSTGGNFQGFYGKTLVPFM